MRGIGAAALSRLSGGGKLGSVGRTSARSDACSMVIGERERMAGRPPGGRCGLVLAAGPAGAHCSGPTALGAAANDSAGDVGRGGGRSAAAGLGGLS